MSLARIEDAVLKCYWSIVAHQSIAQVIVPYPMHMYSKVQS